MDGWRRRVNRDDCEWVIVMGGGEERGRVDGGEEGDLWLRREVVGVMRLDVSCSADEDASTGRGSWRRQRQGGFAHSRSSLSNHGSQCRRRRRRPQRPRRVPGGRDRHAHRSDGGERDPEARLRHWHLPHGPPRAPRAAQLPAAASSEGVQGARRATLSSPLHWLHWRAWDARLRRDGVSPRTWMRFCAGSPTVVAHALRPSLRRARTSRG